jgi:transcriptional regulator with XRE-family HTH domain
MKNSFGKMDDDEKKFWYDLGNKIFEYRKRHGLNQAELGALINRTRVSVANIERGAQRITVYNAHKIFKALNMEVQI